MPRTTLTIEGLPEGDEANTVTVKYTLPVEGSSAWLTDTFTVVDEYVDAGTEPIVSTALNIPGVYRIAEASNKAILKLRRSNNRQRISFVAVDEGIMFQPADVLEINDSSRGITGLEVYVESAVMIDYGRWRITGIRYRDTDYSNECYLEGGKWVDPLGVPIVYIDCLEYACDAYSTAIGGLDINKALYNGSDALGSPFWEYPFAKDTDEDNVNFYFRTNFISSAVTVFDWSSTSTSSGSGVRPCNVSAWSSNDSATYCSEADLAVMIQGGSTPTVLLPPSDMWSEQTDYNVSMIISGYNGTGALTFELFRNTGKRWTVLGTGSNIAEYVFLYCNIIQTSPGYEIRLNIGDGSPGATEDSIFITESLEGVWLHISANVTNADPVLEGNGYRFAASCSLTATRGDTGESQTLSLTGSQYQAASGTVTGVQARAHTQYTAPNLFFSNADTGDRLTLQYLSYSNDGTVDLETLSTAFLRNFEDYQDPNC